MFLLFDFLSFFFCVYNQGKKIPSLWQLHDIIEICFSASVKALYHKEKADVFAGSSLVFHIYHVVSSG